MVTKYGYDVFFTVAVVCVVLILAALVFLEPKVLKYGVVLFSAAFFGFALNFFRDPDRVTPDGEKVIISPADGKVIRAVGVIQISRKGKSPTTAGADFSIRDLTALMSTATLLAKCFKQ